MPVLAAVHAWLPVRLVHGILFVAYTNARFVVAQVVDTPVDVVVDHLTGLQEGLLHVEGRLSRGLQEYQSVLLSEALTLLSAHLPSAIKVGLVADEHHHNVWVSILPNFFKPPRQVVKGLFSCYIVHQKCASSTSVVRSRDAFKRLLASGVPDLELDVLFRDLYCSAAEFDSNRQIVLLSKPLVGELEK